MLWVWLDEVLDDGHGIAPDPTNEGKVRPSQEGNDSGRDPFSRQNVEDDRMPASYPERKVDLRKVPDVVDLPKLSMVQELHPYT